MARDINGNYTLPLPDVLAGTVVDADWANPTLHDLANAMTDSLSRSGSGGMLAPFRFIDGAIGAPGISWANEPTSGMYRAAPGDFRYAVNGVDITRWIAGSFRSFRPIFQSNGNINAPSMSWTAETNSGWYRKGAKQFWFTIDGIDVFGITDSGPQSGVVGSGFATVEDAITYAVALG